MSRLDAGEERISELEAVSTEIFRLKKPQNRTEYPKTVDNCKRNIRRRRKKETKEILETRTRIFSS